MSSWHAKSLRSSSVTLVALGVVIAAAVTAGLVLALRGGDSERSDKVARGSATTRTTTAPQGRSAGWIAYSGPGGIWLVRGDGRNARLVPQTAGLDQPKWSPDGTRLAAVEDSGHAYAFALDGSRRVPLAGEALGTPVWSPDGRLLALQTWEGIRIRSVGGKRPETALPLNGSDPAWSPDGEQIAFRGRTHGEPWRIFLVGSDGSGLQPLLADDPKMSQMAMGTLTPAWARHGLIAFSADWDGDSEIYVARSDGTDLRKLTSNSVQDRSPTWSPDGRSIAFDRSPRNGFSTTKIVVTELATGAETEIVTARGPASMVGFPAWRPTAG